MKKTILLVVFGVAFFVFIASLSTTDGQEESIRLQVFQKMQLR